jgi:hypothetical protein
MPSRSAASVTVRTASVSFMDVPPQYVKATSSGVRYALFIENGAEREPYVGDRTARLVLIPSSFMVVLVEAITYIWEAASRYRKESSDQCRRVWPRGQQLVEFRCSIRFAGGVRLALCL